MQRSERPSWWTDAKASARARRVIVRMAKTVGGDRADRAHELALALAARARQPEVAARLLRLRLKPLAGSGTGGPRVLVLPKQALMDDVRALAETQRLEVWTLPRSCIKAMAAEFLPAFVNDHDYFASEPDRDGAAARYRAFLTRVWTAFDPDARFDALLTAEIVYWAERELAFAVESLGTAFVALQKEVMWTSAARDGFQTRVYRGLGAFGGRAILSYSRHQLDTIVESEVAPADHVRVVGMPRLDATHRWRARHAGTRPDAVVLFVSFLPDVGMPTLARARHRDQLAHMPLTHDGERSPTVDTLCRGAHEAMVEVARHNPEVTVVVKTKGRPRDRNVLPDLLGPGPLPPNLRVVHGGSPEAWLRRAAVVCGLHSTLLLEGLAAGLPVVVPRFGEAQETDASRYLFDLSDVANVQTTRAGFIDEVTRLARERRPVAADLSEPTRAMLDEWLCNADGGAATRAVDALTEIIRGTWASGQRASS